MNQFRINGPKGLLSLASTILVVALSLQLQSSVVAAPPAVAAKVDYQMGTNHNSVAAADVNDNISAASGAARNALVSASTDDAAKPLQFTSGGQVLGFTPDGVIVASASHMLKIDFLNSNAVVPEADGVISQESNTGKAPPLGSITYRNVWDGVTVVYEASGASIMKSTYYVDTTKEGLQSIAFGWATTVR